MQVLLVKSNIVMQDLSLNQEDAQNIIDLFQKISINIIPANILLKDAYEFAIRY